MGHVFGRAWFLTILVALPLPAAGLSGAVVDPSGLPVQGAVVTVVCRTGERSVDTDMNGRFHFSLDAGGTGCQISVLHPHFAVYRKPLSSATEPLSIQLRLASIKQTVTVVADDTDASALPQPTLGSVSLTGDQLRSISNSTAELIQYAKLMAGISGGTDAIYVDGVPSTVLPPADNIARIVVNADPFSAEYSDGDQTHIDIITKNGDRHFRINMGGGALGAGGRNALAPKTAPESNSNNFSLSGPVPFLPVTFSAQAGWGYTLTPLAIQAIPPPALYSGEQWIANNVNSASRNGSASLNFYFSPSETAHGHASYFESRSSSSNAGVGGLVLAESGSDSHFFMRNLLVTLNKSWGALLLRGGIIYTDTAANLQANSDTLGVTVAGGFIAGGAVMSASTSRRTDWIGKVAFESDTPTPAWTAGITIEHTGDAIQQTPNPYGNFVFENVEAYMDALGGQNTGTYFITRGNGSVRYANTAAAPFFQKQIVKRGNLLVSGGVRVDYQSGFGATLSPRLSAATGWRKFVFRSGGGLFVRNLPDDVLSRILENDGSHLQQSIAQNASFEDFGEIPLGIQVPLRSQLASGLTRPREWIEKSSVERRLGKFDTGVEYSWTRDQHLLGSRRLWSGAGWTDFLESDRDAMKNRVHAQLGYRINAQRIVAFYDWTRSRDDTDGPFSFPADQNDIRAEWARSASIAPHSVTLATMLQLPGKISANLTESWHCSSPYNITTGLDPSGDGLYTDRGRLPRNSGNGPSYNIMSIYASRRVGLPTLPKRSGKRIYVRVGLQAANLLDNRNYTSIGSVLGSPTYGMPLSVLPGRSVRLWMNLD